MQTPDGSSDDWKVLWKLMRDRKLGAASKLFFRWCWDHNGGRPGEMSVPIGAVAYDLGRDPRAVHKWMQELGEADLLRICDRDRRRGVVHIELYHPCPAAVDQAERPDPQTKLPLEQPEAAPDDRAGITSAGDRPDLTAPKRPGAPADSSPPPPRQSDVTASRSVSKGPTGSADIKDRAYACAPITKDTKEEEVLNTPKYQRTTQYQTNGSSPRSDVTGPRSASKGPTDPEAESWTLQRLQGLIGSQTGRSYRSSKEPDPAPVGLAMAAAVLQRETTERPLEQKKRLVEQIRSVVQDRDMAPYVSGAAADLVVFHDVRVEEIDKILAQLEAKRQAGTLKTAGGFFHHKARQLAARLRKPWPRGMQKSE